MCHILIIIIFEPKQGIMCAVCVRASVREHPAPHKYCYVAYHAFKCIQFSRQSASQQQHPIHGQWMNVYLFTFYSRSFSPFIFQVQFAVTAIIIIIIIIKNNIWYSSRRPDSKFHFYSAQPSVRASIPNIRANFVSSFFSSSSLKRIYLYKNVEKKSVWTNNSHANLWQLQEHTCYHTHMQHKQIQCEFVMRANAHTIFIFHCHASINSRTFSILEFSTTLHFRHFCHSHDSSLQTLKFMAVSASCIQHPYIRARTMCILFGPVCARVILLL